MIIKIKDILQLYNSIELLINKKLPIKVSFIISKNRKKLLQIKDLFEQQRQNLIKNYAEKDKNNEIIIDENNKVKILNIKSFEKEYNNLLNMEQEIMFDKFLLSDLQMCENNNYNFDILTTKEITILLNMIEEEE